MNDTALSLICGTDPSRAVRREDVPAQVLGPHGIFVPQAEEGTDAHADAHGGGSGAAALGGRAAAGDAAERDAPAAADDDYEKGLGLVEFCAQLSAALPQPWSRPGHYLVAQKLEGIGVTSVEDLTQRMMMTTTTSDGGGDELNGRLRASGKRALKQSTLDCAVRLLLQLQ